MRRAKSKQDFRNQLARRVGGVPREMTLRRRTALAIRPPSDYGSNCSLDGAVEFIQWGIQHVGEGRPLRRCIYELRGQRLRAGPHRDLWTRFGTDELGHY